MQGVVLLALVLLLPSTVLGGFSTVLTYTCDSTGTITMQNPDSATYLSAFAQTSDGAQNCTVDFINNNEAAVIRVCPISINITLWLFDSPTVPENITGDMESHIIRCQQIPATGITRLVTNYPKVTHSMTTFTIPFEAARTALQTQLEDIETGLKKTSAIAGEPVIWEFKGPESYTLLPLNCTVRPVTTTATDESLILVINGCSLDEYILDHFEYASDTEKHILRARMFAFRFASSQQIYIECDMLGCRNTSSSCNFACPGKRRRHVVDDVHDVMERQSAGQPGETHMIYREPSTEPTDIVGHVHTKLTVFGQEINEGSTSSITWTTSFLFTVVAYLLSTINACMNS